MKSKSQGILLLILVGVAVWPWSCRAQGSDTLSSVEEDVYALVIRSQMEQWIADGDKSIAEAKDAREKAIARQLNFQVFFVSVNGRDPSDSFMHRFADLPKIGRA